MPDLTGACIREIGASIRALAWPLVVAVLALSFRQSVAALLGRLATFSLSVPGFGLSVSAPVLRLLNQAAIARATRSPSAAGAALHAATSSGHGGVPASALLWIDERPEAGANEIAALLASGCDVRRIARPSGPGTEPARVIVLASSTLPDAARRQAAGAISPGAALVLYPDEVGPTAASDGSTVVTDPASLFTTVIRLLSGSV